MSEYKIEYKETGIPGTLYKWVTGASELMRVLNELSVNSLVDFDNVKIFRN